MWATDDGNGRTAWCSTAWLTELEAGEQSPPEGGHDVGRRHGAPLLLVRPVTGRVGAGSGCSDGLMRRWFDRLIDTGSPGCYLQTLVENTRAVRLFERMGFEKHGPTPLVPGIRHGGTRLHQQTMVWVRGMPS
jgi:hypothetical protein